MTNKIIWDFIEFEKDRYCIDGVTKESEVEFHIWDDEEIIFGKPEENGKTDFNNITLTLPELI